MLQRLADEFYERRCERGKIALSVFAAVVRSTVCVRCVHQQGLRWQLVLLLNLLGNLRAKSFEDTDQVERYEHNSIPSTILDRNRFAEQVLLGAFRWLLAPGITGHVQTLLRCDLRGSHADSPFRGWCGVIADGDPERR